jgi:hypothetical protein
MTENQKEFTPAEDDLEKFNERSEPEVAELSLVKRIDPATIISKAVDQGVDQSYLETLKGMFELQLCHEENEAKKAHFKAMAKFKAKPPKIYRDLQVKYEVGNKTTEWSHADLGVAADALNIALGENGLNATWRMDQEGSNIKVTCVIAHELGHTEETSMEAPPDKTGSKNDIQAMASTVFYLERYTLFALTGTAPTRMDDDGQKSEAEFITEEQVAELTKKLKEFPDEGAEFLKWAKVETVDTITAGSDHKRILQALKDIKKGK